MDGFLGDTVSNFRVAMAGAKQILQEKSNEHESYKAGNRLVVDTVDG